MQLGLRNSSKQLRWIKYKWLIMDCKSREKNLNDNYNRDVINLKYSGDYNKRKMKNFKL